MAKKIFLFILMLLLAAYLIFAMSTLNHAPKDVPCKQLKLVVKDTMNANFITREEVKKLLEQHLLYPVNKPQSQVQLDSMEAVLNTHPMIARAECYKTPSGTVRVEVKQRIPVLRVISNNGDNYYLDAKGTVMPKSMRFVAYKIVATGNIDRDYAQKVLFPMTKEIENNAFWNNQITQINVLPDKTIELVPRVGKHIIYLGQPEDLASKLQRVKDFYTKALSHVGWNKYERINVEFANQIICTKRPTH